MSRRQLVLAGVLGWLAVFVVGVFVAPFAFGQTTDPPTDPTTTVATDPPPTDPPPTDPPTTAAPPPTFPFPFHHHHRDDPPPTTAPPPPPTTAKRVVPVTRKPVVTTKPKSSTGTTAAKPAPTASKSGVVPFAATGSASTTHPSTTKGKKGSTAGAATGAATANGNAPVADPAQPPATDPILNLAGNDVIRHSDPQKILSAKGLTEGDSGISSVLLIGAAAILPIAGAIAFGGFGDGRRWFRRFASRRYD